MSSVDVHHLAAVYALDALDHIERQTFQVHYDSCEVCQADVAEHRQTLARLAAGSPVAPAAVVRDRVLAEIGQTRQLSPRLPDGVAGLAERRRRRRRAALASLVTAAAAAVVLVVGVLVVDRSSPDFSEQIAAVLEEPDARFLTLTADEAAGAVGTVRVAWSSESGRAAVLGDGLPPAPAGSAYELWLIDDRGPQPMRLLDAAPDGQVRALFDITTVPAAWGITVEPDTGSPEPTGDILFLAET